MESAEVFFGTSTHIYRLKRDDFQSALKNAVACSYNESTLER